MWVILRFHNNYDQYGAYFVGVYKEEDCESPNGHFGREHLENVWYTKQYIQPGVNYPEDHRIHREY